MIKSVKQRKWRDKNLEKFREYAREHAVLYNIILKVEVMEKYCEGGVVRCCIYKENRMDCLSIDHVHGDGNTHRKAIGGGGMKLYRWLKRNNYPEGFRVLCMNCQFIYQAQKKKWGVR